MTSSDEEGGAARVMQIRWRTIGSGGVTIVEGCAHKSVQTSAWEEEAVLQLQAEVVLLGCQVLIVAIEEGLHRSRLRLFGAGCHKGTIMVGVARACLVTTLQRYAKDATLDVQIARQTGCYLAGAQLLLTIVGIEVGRDVALLPVVARRDGPCGQLVADAQVHGRLRQPLSPDVVAS